MTLGREYGVSVAVSSDQDGAWLGTKSEDVLVHGDTLTAAVEDAEDLDDDDFDDEFDDDFEEEWEDEFEDDDEFADVDDEEEDESGFFGEEE